MSVKAPGKAFEYLMRPIITVDANGHLISDLTEATDTRVPIEVGSHFEFETAYSTPWGEVPVGVVATVTEVHVDTGELDLEVTQKIPALFLWSNLLIMLPFMSDDLMRCLRLLG